MTSLRPENFPHRCRPYKGDQHPGYGCTGKAARRPRLHDGANRLPLNGLVFGQGVNVLRQGFYSGGNPAPRIPVMSITGQTGRVVDYATGDVVPGTTLGLRAVARPLDRFEIEVRRDANDLGVLAGEPHRLRETVQQVVATYYFKPAFYALLNVQDYRSTRRFPLLNRSHEVAASLQFNWQVARELMAYGGIRSNTAETGIAGTRGRSTEIYLKLARTFRR